MTVERQRKRGFAMPFNDGWPDNFGPAWFIWQQEAARARQELRKALPPTPSDDLQFDRLREAEQAGCSIREVDNVKYRHASTGGRGID